MATTDTLHAIVDPIVASLDATVYDLEFDGGVLRIAVDRAGGIDLDTVAEVTRQVSRQLDLDDPITSKYTLEVSSPGLERTLRTPLHWASAVGESVRIKLKPHVDGDRRIEGTVVGAAGERVTVDVAGSEQTVDIADIDRARTMFVWGGQDKPGKATSNTANSTKSAKAAKSVDAMSVPSDSLNESENS